MADPVQQEPPGPQRSSQSITQTGSWSEISDLFTKCLDLPEDERARLLSEFDCSRPEVAFRLRELLEEYRKDDGFLERSAIDRMPGLDDGGDGNEAKSAVVPKNAGPLFFSKPAVFYLFLLINAIALAFYVSAIFPIVNYGKLTVDAGWYERRADAGWQVAEVTAGGSAEGKLLPGDRILAINGDARLEGLRFQAALAKIRPGASYTMRVSRNRQTLDVSLRNEVRPNERVRGDAICFLAVSLAFFVAAILIGMLKPNGRVARFAYAALLSEALVLLRTVMAPYEDFLGGTVYTGYTFLLMLDGVHFALAYLFYCVFFDDLRGSRRRSLILPVLVPWSLVISISHAVYPGRSDWSFLDQHLFLFRALSELEVAFYFVAPVSICVLIAGNYIAMPMNPESRQRARWIGLGSLAGILPYVVFRLLVILSELSPSRFAAPWYQSAFRISVLAAGVIPIATAYAILKHRTFGIEVVIRRGVQYILLKRVLQAILLLPALALVVSLIRNSQRTVADALWHNGFSILLILLLSCVLRFRVPLTRWLDKRFFRESYDREQILLPLIESVKNLSSLEEVARTVGEQVSSALHPLCFFVLYREETSQWLKTAYRCGRSEARVLLATESPLLAALEGHNDGEYLSALRHSIPDTKDVDRLESLGAELVIPFTSVSDSIEGLLLLGPKRSDASYTGQDRRLLSALAGQMAIVYENLSLQRRLDNERKMSTEVQVRLGGKRIKTFRECPRCGRCFDVGVVKCDRDENELILSLPMSRVIDERYRLDRLIGRGGMGSVYEGQDLRLNRTVAIKIVTGHRVDPPNWLKRAYREARAVARLNHPNIIATYDFGISGEEFAYLVMEFVPGETLRSALSAGRVAPDIAADWSDQLLGGLCAAHQAGIVHRDLKPENVLITNTGGRSCLKILDFGIAKISPDGHQSSEMTVPGSLLGSIQYMSPEQLNGEPADARSDIFAVGVIIFELLTGRHPFPGNTHTERIIALLHTQAALPAAMPSDLLLNEALQKCLKRKPEDRFQSAAELRLEIVPLITNYSGVA